MQSPVRFRITVHRIEEVETHGSISDLIEERHYTDKEINESHNWMRGDDAKKDYLKKVYSARPVTNLKEVETKIFEQTIEGMDVTRVILAVNEKEIQC